MIMKKPNTRGYRNKNPFNIKISDNMWKGKKPDYERTDSTFEQFYSIDFGLRAGLVLFNTYFFIYGLKTPREMIERFAPGTENDLKSYLFFISGFVPLDKPLVHGSDNWYNFLVAILKYESQYDLTKENLRYVARMFNLPSYYDESDPMFNKLKSIDKKS